MIYQLNYLGVKSNLFVVSFNFFGKILGMIQFASINHVNTILTYTISMNIALFTEYD